MFTLYCYSNPKSQPLDQSMYAVFGLRVNTEDNFNPRETPYENLQLTRSGFPLDHELDKGGCFEACRSPARRFKNYSAATTHQWPNSWFVARGTPPVLRKWTHAGPNALTTVQLTSDTSFTCSLVLWEWPGRLEDH
jgi:hypothetical protein